MSDGGWVGDSTANADEGVERETRRSSLSLFSDIFLIAPWNGPEYGTALHRFQPNKRLRGLETFFSSHLQQSSGAIRRPGRLSLPVEKPLRCDIYSLPANMNDPAHSVPD